MTDDPPLAQLAAEVKEAAMQADRAGEDCAFLGRQMAEAIATQAAAHDRLKAAEKALIEAARRGEG